MNFIMKLLGLVKADPELDLEIRFRKDPQGTIEEVIQHFQNAPKFKGDGSFYRSSSGWATVEKDIYTYVYLRGNPMSISYCPEDYGLTEKQGAFLEAAILSCVPGTVFFKARFYDELAKVIP